MDVSIGEVQAQVESAGQQPTASTQDGNKRMGLTQKNHEQRLQQRRAQRIHDRLCAK